MTSYFLLTCLLLPQIVSGFIMPMTKPSGEPDLTSIISHVTLMEQTISSLQTQVQTSTTDLASVKTKLQTTETELASVQSNLRSTETDLALVKHDLEKSPDPTEFANMKSELDALKVSYNTLKSQINFTVLDTISRDVKSNTNNIHSLNSLMSSTSASNNKTVTAVQKNEEELVSLKSQLTSLQSQTNVSQELAATKSLVQNTTSELKDVQAQISSISGVVSSIQHGLNNTDVKGDDVAFQVSQSTTLVSGSTTLLFDTVAYNHASGYDNSTGMFTAPIAGTYIFWTNIEFHSIATRSNYVYIIKGQTKLATGYTTLTPTAGILFSVASAITVAHLDVGEQVHFSTGTTDNKIIGIGESRYGGALLRPA